MNFCNKLSLLVALLIVVAITSTLEGCDQATSTSATGPAGEAIRYTSNYINKEGHLVEADFAISAVNPQGNSRAIVTLKQSNPDVIAPTISLHIFGYGGGKFARFIRAGISIGPLQGLPMGSPSQIQVVDLNNGKTTVYQAPPEIDTSIDYSLSKTPFSADGSKLIVPDNLNGRYYVLNLDTGQTTLIPNLKGSAIVEIIGWSAADGLIYARTVGSVGGVAPVERFSLQGSSEELNLQQLSGSKGSGDNIYDEVLSPDGKDLYYETITSTLPLPPAQINDLNLRMNVIERYDIATGNSTVVAHAAAGDYFGVHVGNFALSSDGRALAYIEQKSTSAGNSQSGDVAIWRIDLTSNSEPVKVIAGLNSPFRLLWCNNSLYYDDSPYFSGEDSRHNWYSLLATGSKTTKLDGEILGCAP